MKKIISYTLILSASLIALTGCNTLQDKSYMQQGTNSLNKDRIQTNSNSAIAKYSELAAKNPFDSNSQTLLAMAYQENSNSDPEAINLAFAGYDLAIKSGKDAYWAANLAGKLAFDSGQFKKAQSYFTHAIISRPDSPNAYIAMANSAYMAGDPKIAALVAERARILSTDNDDLQASLRIAALANAASGKKERAFENVAEYSKLNLNDANLINTRVINLIRTNDTEKPIENISPIADNISLNQVSVDVAIILSQTTQKDTIGLNLLDGLQAQYGRQQQTSDNSGNISKTITEAITIPQLNYNLNLFNRFGQYYQVVARPMLTAYRGEAADFFVGRSAKVAVGGVNFAQLENVDIGTQVKVTPQEITNEGAKLRIEVTRSFLATEPAGNFAEALNTFRQTVASTVEVKFGSTLILSGLSESVKDTTGSKTPFIGDAPIVGSAFNKRITTNRRDSVLILVTPSPSKAFSSRPWSRPADVERLIELWGNVIAPGSDMTAINNGLSHSRLFTRAKREDGQLTWPNLPRDKGQILKDLLLP